MKKLFYYLSLPALALVLFAAACKKDGDTTSITSATPPKLTANVTDTIRLAKPNAAANAITFSWTNPTFQLSTGATGTNIGYALQIKKSGSTADFKTVENFKNVLTATITQGNFNGYLTKLLEEGGLQLPADSIVKVDVRIVAYMGTSSYANVSNTASNTLTFTVNKPYSVFPDLYIVGDATPDGWTSSPSDNQKFAFSPTTKLYTIQMNFVPGKYYKFLEVKGQWQPQWGGCGPTGGTIQGNPATQSNDPDAITTPSTAGSYKITVSLINKTCTVSP